MEIAHQALARTTGMLSPLSSRGDLQSDETRQPKIQFARVVRCACVSASGRRETTLVRELQEVMTQPYAEQSKDVEEKYYRLKPSEFFEVGGLSYYSCSS